ncbi:MAG: HAD family hydrolase [Myxococcota bacterium]
MDQREREPLVVTSDELVERLREIAATHPAALLAFDGDGTLWSGDVGEDVFHQALKHGLLRDAALPALQREANKFGVPSDGNANDVAARLFTAYLEQRYPERDVCAMMTWCYAGMRREELIDIARTAFAERHLAERLHEELAAVFAYARGVGIRTIVVSASPQPIVETAAAHWRIEPSDIAASRAREHDGLILDELAAPVPYADGKPIALRELVPNAELVAAFGDNAFDVELFQAAHIGVAVRPKPALRRRFAEVKSLCILAEPVSAR